jgi:NitT/TauT family transport system ATP-binding protein
MDTIISLKNVGKIFEQTQHYVEALVDISFDVRENEFVSILGPSGCGKSTLLKVIAGLDKDYTGEASVAGHDVRQTTPSVCLMHQKDLLLPWRSVLDNVALPLELRGVPKAERQQTALAHFEEFGLKGFERMYPHQLSGGMRQRAALMRTFLDEGDVYLMDELLDVWNKHRKAVVFVTHDIEEAVFLSDRILVLSERPAKVAHVFEVNLPRPRNRGMLEDSAFLKLRRAVQEAL